MSAPTLDIGGTRALPRISDYVDRYALRTPQATAVVCSGRRIDYGTLKRRVDAFAKALLAAGVRKRDRVAMLSTPRAEFWIAFLATAKLGAIWVGLNPRYSVRECDYVVADAGPLLLVAIAEYGGTRYQAHVDALLGAHPGISAVAFAGSLGGAVPLDDFVAEGRRIGDAELQAAAAGVATLDPALIVYTSGSSGQPKGAVLTHYGLSYGAMLQTAHFGLESPSIVVSFPVNHVASVADTCATTLVKGGKIVFLEHFDPAQSIEATAAERCTLIGGVPTMYQLQMSSPAFARADLSSLELALWGGAAMPEEIIRRLQALGVRLMTAYGMTETATHVTYTAPEADVDVLANTVGKPDPRCELRIATADGRPSSEDNAGEIQLKADFLMAGYWNRDEATRAAHTEDGWFRTGDVGYLRDDGNLRLVGRMSDMFKSGGYNVYPREIEAVLEQHGAVAMAAVVSRPDGLYQEVGCAWIETEAGQDVGVDELEAWCRERLANYKVPKSFRVVEKLPLLPVGKIDKQALRRMTADE